MARYVFLLSLVQTLVSCQSDTENTKQSIYGIGPIEKIELATINDSIMKMGMETFNSKCNTCHTMEYKNTGPDLSDILSRRQPEWVLNYLINHKEMQATDSIAIKTKLRYKGNCVIKLSEEEAYAILEYFRIYQIWLHEFNVN